MFQNASRSQSFHAVISYLCGRLTSSISWTQRYNPRFTQTGYIKLYIQQFSASIIRVGVQISNFISIKSQTISPVPGSLVFKSTSLSYLEYLITDFSQICFRAKIKNKIENKNKIESKIESKNKIRNKINQRNWTNHSPLLAFDWLYNLQELTFQSVYFYFWKGQRYRLWHTWEGRSHNFQAFQ